MGQGVPFKGTSYAGKNNFGVYRLCAMTGLVNYIRYIPCVEMFNVPSPGYLKILILEPDGYVEGVAIYRIGASFPIIPCYIV